MLCFRGHWTSSTCRPGRPKGKHGSIPSWQNITGWLIRPSCKRKPIYSSGNGAIWAALGFLTAQYAWLAIEYASWWLCLPCHCTIQFPMRGTLRVILMVLDASLWPSRRSKCTKLFWFEAKCCFDMTSQPWPQGPLQIDEAVEVAKTICNGDPASALFALMPLCHASTDKQTVKGNKRILEDKIDK